MCRNVSGVFVWLEPSKNSGSECRSIEETASSRYQAAVLGTTTSRALPASASSDARGRLFPETSIACLRFFPQPSQNGVPFL
jgi:hypothetical protein